MPRKTRRVLDPVRDLLHLRRLDQRPGPGASDPDVPRFRHSAGAGREPARRPWACSISSAPSSRAGCRTATTIAVSCSGITACAACRCCSCRSPISRSTGCRCLRCSMGSTGSRPCRRRCGSPRSASARSAPTWCSAGSLPAISSAPATAAFGAGLSRTLLATYLPAFFAAGALCIVAALIVLAIARQPKPVAA